MTGVQADDYRLKVQQLNQAIAERAKNWTFLGCTASLHQRTALVLALEPLQAVAWTTAELLALAQAARGPLLVICADGDEQCDPLELIQQLRALQRPDPCRVLIGVEPECSRARLQQLWSSGADGLLALQSTGEGQLLEAVLTVLRGLHCLDPLLRHQLHQGRGGGAIAGALELSQREQELLRLLARGRTATEIAALQQLRCDTVRRQLSVLYRRTGVRNQRSLLAWGLEQGLLRPHDLVCQLR